MADIAGTMTNGNGHPAHDTHDVNVSTVERVASALGGGALAVMALKKHNAASAALALAGGYLLYRGVTGHCAGYSALHTGTAGPLESENASVPHNQGIKVEKVMTINRSPEELFAFWRRFDNLPRFMKHVESVTVQDETRSHWVVRAPAGKTVEWDAEVINESPNEMIAWRSVENADIANAGSVWFKPAPGGRGTEVKVSLEYRPPAGILGAAIARLWGEEPEQQVNDDLRRFKQMMEAGEIPTTDGQPSGGKGKE